jgi:hypothetical protein
MGNITNDLGLLYHLSLVTIETIIKRQLPFLLPFVVESELRSIKEASTSKAMAHLQYLRQQIDTHEAELTQMIEALTADQMESLRTTIEYLWGKSYSKEVFNKSTLLTLMREQLNFRQKDIDWGRSEGITEGFAKGITEGITEGIAKRTAKEMSVFQRLLQDGKINQEQLEDFLKYMEEEDEKQKSSANINKQ